MNANVKQYIYVIKPTRPALVTDPGSWTDEEMKIGEAHFSYLKKATEAGIVLLAGRALDGLGPAVVVFTAGSEEEALLFMQEDPFIAEGLMRAELHPFRAALIGGKA